MKKCNMCNQMVNDDAAFCTNCGSSNFTPMNSVPGQNFGNAPRQGAPQQGFGNAPQQGAPQRGFGNAPQQGAPRQGFGNAPQQGAPRQGFGNAPQNSAPQQNFGNAPRNSAPQQGFGNAPQNGFGVPTPPVVNNTPPKKSKKGLIIGLSVGGGILLILIILAIIGATAEKKYQSEGYGNSDSSSYSSDSEQTTAVESAVPYTIGEFDSSAMLYKNEWANLQVQLDNTWTEQTKDAFAQYESERSKCGLYVTSSTNDVFMILFYDTTGSGEENLSISDYVDQIQTGVEEKATVTNSSVQNEVVLGDEVFTNKVLTLDTDGTEVFYHIYAMKKDGKFVTIQIITRDNNRALDIADKITAYQG